MPPYIALYVNGTITAVFSSSEQYYRGCKAIYKPQYRDYDKKCRKNPHLKKTEYGLKYLHDDLHEDDEFCIYMLVLEDSDAISEKFFSTKDKFRDGVDLEAKRHAKVTGYRVVVDHAYERGVLSTPPIYK